MGNPESRYLGLTGVVIDSEVYRARTRIGLAALKDEFFPHDPDDQVILVRNQIIRMQKEILASERSSGSGFMGNQNHTIFRHPRLRNHYCSFR